MKQFYLQAVKLLTVALFLFCLAFPLNGVVAHQRIDSAADWVELGKTFLDSSDVTDEPLSGDVYILPASGAEVVVGPDITADDPAESGFADQLLLNLPDGHSIGAIAVIPGSDDPVQTLDAYMGGFEEEAGSVEEIDFESDGKVASAIYLVEFDTYTTAMFIVVDSATWPGNQIIQVVISETTLMEDSIVVLRDNISVDGVPMFMDVDEVEIAAIVQGAGE